MMNDKKMLMMKDEAIGEAHLHVIHVATAGDSVAVVVNE